MKKSPFVVLAALTAITAAAADFPEWMAGSWRVAAGGEVVEEHWTAAVMLGIVVA